MDRIVHNAIRVDMGKANMRQRQDAGRQQQKDVGAHVCPNAQTQ